MSMASMKAEPMMPKVVVTPLATIVSTKASLGVMRVMGMLLWVPEFGVAADGTASGPPRRVSITVSESL